MPAKTYTIRPLQWKRWVANNVIHYEALKYHVYSPKNGLGIDKLKKGDCMNKEIKDKWVAALESGEYRQTQRQLKDWQGFCCLGVLCDIHAKEVGTMWVTENNSASYLQKHATLPKEVEEWAGIDRKNWRKLISLNDDRGYSFEKIAEVIKRTL